MKETMTANRIRRGDVDLLRALGIILMVMGHVEFGVSFDKYIHAFHMPLWFIVSGYFFNTHNSLNFVAKKAKTLIIPYLTFGLFYVVLFSLRGGAQWSSLLYPNHIIIPYNGALWFLPALFFSEVIAFLILKYLPLYLSYAIIFSLAWFGTMNLVDLPLSLDSSLVGTGFILAGILIKKYESFLLNIKPIYALIILAINFFLIFKNGYVNMRSNEYGIHTLFWLNAIIGVLCLWNLLKYINSKVNLQIIKEIGAQSIIYVCMNQFCLFILSKLLNLLPFYEMDSMIFKSLKLILVLAGCFACNRIILKTRFKFFIGK